MRIVKKFRAGRRQQHESLLSKTTSYGPYSEAELQRMGQEAIPPKEQLEALYQWANWAMDTCGLPEGTEITRDNKDSFVKAMPSVAMDARGWISLAATFRRQGKHESAFNALLKAIPSLMGAQVLVHEDLIRAGRSRTGGAIKQKQVDSRHIRSLAKPIYDTYRLKHSTRGASRLTAKKLKTLHGITKPNETIRSWFK